MKNRHDMLYERVIVFKRLIIISILIILSLCIITGCEDEEKSQLMCELDYTLVPDEDVPDALAAIIEEKKSSDMMLTYATEGELYIVRGYGTRATDGYSLQVDSLYQAEDYIYFETTLTGPIESTTSIPSYPYIVIKTKYIDLPVSFQ